MATDEHPKRRCPACEVDVRVKVVKGVETFWRHWSNPYRDDHCLNSNAPLTELQAWNKDNVAVWLHELPDQQVCQTPVDLPSSPDV